MGGHPADRRAGAGLRARKPTTLLAQLPLALDRAALFHPPLLGAWALWVLAALVAFAVPVALAAAVAAAARSDTS